jgi:hypothetical protein
MLTPSFCFSVAQTATTVEKRALCPLTRGKDNGRDSGRRVLLRVSRGNEKFQLEQRRSYEIGGGDAEALDSFRNAAAGQTT